MHLDFFWSSKGMPEFQYYFRRTSPGWSQHIVPLLKDWYQKGIFTKLLAVSIRFILNLFFTTKLVVRMRVAWKQQVTWIFRTSWIAPKKERVLWNWISVDVTRSHVLLGFQLKTRSKCLRKYLFFEKNSNQNLSNVW